MKLFLMPRELSWWTWAAITACLLVGHFGHPAGYVAAIALSFAQTFVFAIRARSLRDFRVQIRLTYAVCLVLYWPWPALYGIPTLGTLALLVFGYCLLARILSLCPWNREAALTPALVWRTFTAAPVAGNPRHGLPGGCRCELERVAAH